MQYTRLSMGLLAITLLLVACDKPTPPATQPAQRPDNSPEIQVSRADDNADNSIGQQLSGNDDAAPTKAASTVPELQWEELIPPDWRPDPDLVFKYNNGEIGDDDPRIVALKIKIEKMEKLAPVNNRLNGKQVKLPGFVVPLEGDATEISEFLLVPYHGACIHVPPPPANQIVYVRSRDGRSSKRQLMETVWVTGTMKVEKVKSQVAEAGYTLIADDIETYDGAQ